MIGPLRTSLLICQLVRSHPLERRMDSVFNGRLPDVFLFLVKRGAVSLLPCVNLNYFGSCRRGLCCTYCTEGQET